MQEAKAQVILIAYYFPPNPAIGAARPYRFYKYLKRAGYRCHVITASDPGAAASPDVHFIPDDVAPLWESPGKGCLPFKAHVERMVRRFALPGDLGIVWSVEAARRCRAIVRRNRGGRFVLFSSYPPGGVLLAGLLAAYRERIPWIADFRDPLAGPDPGRLRFAGPIVAGLRAAVFRKAGAIIANTELMGAGWASAFPRARSRMHVIWNGFDPEERPTARGIPARPYRLLVHAGTLYVGRNPNLILESLARLRETEPEAHAVRVLLVGPLECDAGLDEALCARTAREDWLDFRPKTIPQHEARKATEEADLLLLLQPQSKIQVPGKLFEYISIGRPIVAVVPRSSTAEYVLAHAGVPHVCIYPDDEPAVRDGKLLEALRFSSEPVRFNSWFGDRFQAARQAAQLAEIIDAIGAGEDFQAVPAPELAERREG